MSGVNFKSKLGFHCKNDALAAKLSKVLTRAGIKNKIGLKFGSWEIDIVVIFRDMLILMECKHSLHPGDLYELSRTYDYFKMAEKQLNRAVGHYLNKDLIKNTGSSGKLRAGL